MNFLCHSEIAFFISKQTPSLIGAQAGMLAGAVLGDFLKGPIKKTWDPSLAIGIKLHRKIDAMSNKDLVIKSACNRFPSRMRRIAPILIDIVSDYFLAHNWKIYQEIDLNTFSTKCHSALNSYENISIVSFSKFLEYMKKNELLTNSGNWDSIERTTFSVLQRLGKEDELTVTLKEMEYSEALLSEDFKNFYPRLRSSSLDWVQANQSE